MATTRILLFLLCFVPFIGSWLPDRHLLSNAGSSKSTVANYGQGPLIGSLWKGASVNKSELTSNAEAEYRIVSIAEKALGVREQHGKNDGIAVETYLRYVKLGKGYPWCAAFVSWVFGQAGYSKPRSAWSPDLFPSSRIRSVPKIAVVLGIYFPALKRIAHVGLVTGLQHDWVESVEGNTNAAGSREGDGVYRRLRHKRFINRYALYL
jgi:hypothetical protein